MRTRNFGKTGLQTSLLGFGGFHLLEIPVSEASYLLNRYLDAGGNYIETAAGYGDGESGLPTFLIPSFKINQVLERLAGDITPVIIHEQPGYIRRNARRGGMAGDQQVRGRPERVTTRKRFRVENIQHRPGECAAL